MKLLVLDGHSVANKAFYGVHSLNAPDGTPTNAIQGFINMFTRLYDTYSPDAVCVCFDMHAPTFRHKADENYKANRHPMPDDFAVQMPILRSVVDLMGINVYEKEGFEADDLLGTIGRVCEDSGWDCIIATGDRDSFQLITDRVNICYLGKDNVLYSPELFREQYGYEPVNIIDYKSIAGDSSDNYSGVQGIGDKGATDLIKAYGTLDAVYENLDKIKPALKAKLENGRESAYHSRFLATIDRFVPFDFSPEENLWSMSFKPGLYGELKRLGFYRQIEKWCLCPDSTLSCCPVASEEKLPEGVVLTPCLKDDIRACLDRGEEYDGEAFDTGLAQYLINPTQKVYAEDVSYGEMSRMLSEMGLEKLYYGVELPLCRVLASMEHEGFLVDRQALVDFGEGLSGDIERLKESIYSHAGCEFNINSPKQLGDILFDKLQLPSEKKRSTNADFLDKIKNFHPIVGDILEYRMLSKLKSTYADGLVKVISDDGRIHTSFQMTVTATGRLSSTEPNLQNIPIRKELGGRIRNMFIAAPGNVLVDADYSQIELRLLAHIADDKEMIKAFQSGEDFHTYTASQVFGVPLDAVTPELRGRAKAVNFGIVYGISPFSLSQDIGVSTAEAKKWMDAYFSKYTGVRKYMDGIVKKAETDGFVTTLFGRRRPIPELASSNHAEREFGKRVALNMPIQGTAADVIKMAMIEVYRRLEGMSGHLVLQVHDELIVECPESEAFETAAMLREAMESVAELSVPLLADVKIGKTWSEAH